MSEIKYYELNPSQEVVKLQCTYTLFKRVINIIASATAEKQIDLKIMKDAINKVVERHDCLRLRFVKKDKKLMQYFAEQHVYEEIPYIEFKTKEEQENFFLKIRKNAIKYMKGVVFEPYFCKTYDGKFMVAIKACHLILDIYGLNMVLKDIFDVYESLATGSEMPPQPSKFEDLVQKDLIRKANKEIYETNRKYFTDLLQSNEEPYYTGINGPHEPIWQKQVAKGKRAMKMFFINNQTEGHMHPISKEIVEKAMKYCAEIKCSLSNFFFFTCVLTASRINGNLDKVLPLELCNCRGTLTERNASGTKVQSVGSYTKFNFENKFEEALLNFNAQQANLYRYIGFKDMDFEMLLHKTYPSSMLETYYAITYSFIPFKKPEGIEFQIYSNGRCALPAYIALMWNIDTNTIDMVYDCQTKIISKEDVKRFHQTYLGVINQVLENKDKTLKDIEV